MVQPFLVARSSSVSPMLSMKLTLLRSRTTGPDSRSQRGFELVDGGEIDLAPYRHGPVPILSGGLDPKSLGQYPVPWILSSHGPRAPRTEDRS